jgi:putative FmdB family regulatory protein
VPIYEYKCTNGHTFEAIQRMADDPLTDCEECGAPVERVFHPVAVHFKGSGFYTTDYGSKSKSKSSGSSEEGESKSSEGDSKPTDGSKTSDGSKKDSSKSDTAAKSSSGD